MSVLSPAGPHDPYAALRLPEFRRLLSARVCMTVATQIQGVVVSWQMFQLTNDPLALGLIGLAEAIPSIVVSLYAGHVADSVRRKNIIVAAVTALLFCSVTLFLLTRPVGSWLLAKDQFYTLPLYAVIFVSGIARGFLGPALFSFMPQLIPDRERLSNAITWNSTTYQAAAVLGPAIGGLLFAKAGINTAYGVDAVLMALALLLYGSIASRALPPIEGERLNLKESILSGVQFIFSNQLVLAALSLDLFAVLFGGAVALLPIFADTILRTGPEGLGYLRAAPAVGSVLMAVLMTYYPLRRQAGRKLLWAVAGFGVATICFALSRNFWLSLVLLFLTGAFDAVSVIVRSTLLHTFTPEHMKGRVSAVNNIFIGSSNEIGSFESGAAARLMGVVPSVIFGGAMTLLVVGITAIKADKLRRLDLTPEPKPVAAV
ncbi:major facilitator superfamily MFS_1 [Hymenobacter roseosalivarius DSM 11622]|uniref:Major facilitator superfamily MFS_1 n=1 Tax=Hymenobacter roseosalivarius DSM 11622 TaxID=645990 RepID=A0A1W1V0W4_9BACT|nr:MFS transporter [Hymenobacter roseosalivarius]SMB86995.1 major facilitator superfamily MFS_1 [Hymenobacter roseosalivarius DSM 11622]